mmetsp:Transcript_31419/g.74691  ORF Transcript_31419/g.74691 Transcript_31419/m.74691 type:complete len:340 (-) Transcript_31419:319-1338(-)
MVVGELRPEFEVRERRSVQHAELRLAHRVPDPSQVKSGRSHRQTRRGCAPCKAAQELGAHPPPLVRRVAQELAREGTHLVRAPCWHAQVPLRPRSRADLEPEVVVQEVRRLVELPLGGVHRHPCPAVKSREPVASLPRLPHRALHAPESVVDVRETADPVSPRRLDQDLKELGPGDGAAPPPERKHVAAARQHLRSHPHVKVEVLHVCRVQAQMVESRRDVAGEQPHSRAEQRGQLAGGLVPTGTRRGLSVELPQVQHEASFPTLVHHESRADEGRRHCWPESPQSVLLRQLVPHPLLVSRVDLDRGTLERLRGTSKVHLHPVPDLPQDGLVRSRAPPP